MKNDPYILEMIEDENYQIFESGKILTRKAKTGKIFVNPDMYRELAVHNKNGHPCIKYKNRMVSLSRVIFAKFTGFLPPHLVISSKDGNPLNVSFDNLEAITRGEANKKRFKKYPAVKGAAKLTPLQVRSIRALYKDGFTYEEIGKIYGRSKGHICDIVKMKIWKDI